LAHPEVFSKLGVFSPSFWFNDSVFTMAENFNHQDLFKIYMLVGQLEGEIMVNDQVAMNTLLLNNGFSADEVTSIVSADGQHSEWFWQREFENAYLWMFEDYAVRSELTKKNENVFIYPIPASDYINIDLENKEFSMVQLFDNTGRLMFSSERLPNNTINLTNIPSGLYTLRIIGNNVSHTQNIVVAH